MTARGPCSELRVSTCILFKDTKQTGGGFPRLPADPPARRKNTAGRRQVGSPHDGTSLQEDDDASVPAGAKIVEVGGKLTARWKGRGKRAKWMTAPVVTLDDGRQVIRQESPTYFARYRDQDKALITVSTGCRDESAAKQVLADLEKRVERIVSKVATAQELTAADRRQSPIREHVEEYVSRLPGKKTVAASPFTGKTSVGTWID